ncbi:unnamed protein product [Ectocarpus sp. 12 AP-2014]
MSPRALRTPIRRFCGVVEQMEVTAVVLVCTVGRVPSLAQPWCRLLRRTRQTRYRRGRYVDAWGDPSLDRSDRPMKSHVCIHTVRFQNLRSRRKGKEARVALEE